MTAIRLVHSISDASPVSLLTAKRAVDKAQCHLDFAADELVRWLPFRGARLTLARYRYDDASRALEAARNRRDRLSAESRGESWLRVVGGEHD